MGQFFSKTKPEPKHSVLVGAAAERYVPRVVPTLPVSSVPSRREAGSAASASVRDSEEYSYGAQQRFFAAGAAAASAYSGDGGAAAPPYGTYRTAAYRAVAADSSDYEEEYGSTHRVAEYMHVRTLPAAARAEESRRSAAPVAASSGKAFGYYQCSCGNHWTSAHSWADETQGCKTCGEDVLPYKQKLLEDVGALRDQGLFKKPHEQSLCGKCKKLDRSCTLLMEYSKSTKNPKDLRVKGLSLDITEKKLREMFAPYGEILRVHLLPVNPQFPDRIAFITFRDPEDALRNFHDLDYSMRHHATTPRYGR